MESIQNAYQGFSKQNYTMLDNLKLGYGGTKEEMVRLIADKYHGTTVSKLDTNIEDKYQWIRDEIVFLKEDRARLDERIKYYESRLPEGELNE